MGFLRSLEGVILAIIGLVLTASSFLGLIVILGSSGRSQSMTLLTIAIPLALGVAVMFCARSLVIRYEQSQRKNLLHLGFIVIATWFVSRVLGPGRWVGYVTLTEEGIIAACLVLSIPVVGIALIAVGVKKR